MDLTEKLLCKTHNIVEECRKQASETGELFNIFDITGMKYKEVLVCRVIGELLNPQGSHCQGSRYL
ncbi:MAG: PD-(D/E)XK nuclease family protein, partial [Lachnospiraceae bacterium]|nr:PD-(D/E)XK nuclease family protein [Lachnospiraceae bacterium]